ncbi:YceI family protein [Niveibacterium sp. SC-1]|uniref:YceI family protein n=1 Tax=Niveibacterium sp. SC-1 TaxID=3135646 RepID=UPI00311DD1DD
MHIRMHNPWLGLGAALLCALAGSAAQASEVTYLIDPTHSYPSFEADHMGISVWRGKFNKSGGQITLDKAAGTGKVEVTVDMNSADFGLELMNEAARADSLFDTAKFPQAVYRGTLAGFKDGAPTRVDGELELHGRKQPLTLQIRKFKCLPHPIIKRELCGADAAASFQRDAFGMDAGKDYGFDMTVDLRIQVEAIAKE